MKGIVKLAAVCCVSGMAYKAGMDLWDDVLRDKIYDFVDNFEKAKDEKKKKRS